MSFSERKPIRTQDGSFSLELADGSETYHSRHGALQESRYVFIEKGLDGLSILASVAVLEVGFGTGLNALLAWQWAQANERPVHFITLETYPLTREEWQAISFEVDVQQVANPFTELHEAEWNKPIQLSPFFTLEKRTQSWLEYHETDRADVLFFDAFGPPTQPEMWTAHALFRAAQALRPNGIFVTYCAKGVVRRRLAQAGLNVERLPGPPGKREMLRAVRSEHAVPAPARFNLRAYFILFNAAKDAVLVSEECIAGESMTKFPGGGVEFGEGPEDTVEREALEELGRSIEITGHFYTTGFFQRSAFRAQDQLVSIYYTAKLSDETPLNALEADAPLTQGVGLQLRWVPCAHVSEWPFTFPVDRHVAKLLAR